MLMYFLANRILIASAVIPAILLLVQIYRADRLEPEPPGLLISLVINGILATVLALIGERIGMLILSLFLSGDSLVYRILFFFVVVALSEEGAKYLLLRRRTWQNPNFNCQFDGVVYAVFVALGFALWENISYVQMYGLGTALVRAVTAVPGHACFGVFMGAWYGLAKRYENMGDYAASAVCRRRALLIPALLHGLYDFIASSAYDYYGLIFLVFIAILFVHAIRLVRRLSDTDEYI